MHDIASVMSTPVVTVTPDTSFKDAVRIMHAKRVSGLPVVDSKGSLVGIVTEGDLLNKVEQRDPDAYILESREHRLDRGRASATDVASAMSTAVTSARPDFPIALAAREMHTRGFKRLPVVDERGKLVGIVSRGDLLTVFLRPDTKVQADVRRALKAAEEHQGGSGLKAKVTDGVVELEGTFEDRSRLETTVRAVTGIEGVVGVRSHLTYAADDI
ncbi:MAG: CBS domain-containing protein [Candidatus Dormiibacterota bacterium]